MGPSLFTRSGVILSAAVHGGALLLVLLFTGANPFDSEATEAISVDIVSPSEAPPDPWALPPEQTIEPPKPQLNLATLTPSSITVPTPPQPEAKPAETSKAQRDTRRSDAPASSPAKGQVSGNAAPPQSQQAQPPQQGQPPQQAQASQQAQAPQQAQASQQTQAAQQAQAPQQAQASQQAQQLPMKGATADGGMGGDQGSEKPTSVANMFSMPLALPDGRLGGAFDAPATEAAKIERSSVDAFRERIKSCAMLPAGVSPSDRVSLVIRIGLKRDGTLAGQPTLVEASASPKGPAVLQSLFAGLTKCQPFNMLPPDKYQEWRTLDIRFTPQDLGQG